MPTHTVTLDDNPIVAKLVEGYTGMPSYVFSTGEQLLGAAEGLDPVGVFVDVHLAGHGSGIDAIPKIRAQWPLAAILVVTGDSDPKRVGQALAAGANDFLRKPLIKAELLGRFHARVCEMQARETAEYIELGNGRFNLRKRYLEGPHGTFYLSPLQSELMRVMLENEGVLVPKEALKRSIWGKIAVSDNALDRRLSEMRKIFRESGVDVQLVSEYGKGISLQLRQSRSRPRLARPA